MGHTVKTMPSPNDTNDDDDDDDGGGGGGAAAAAGSDGVVGDDDENDFGTSFVFVSVVPSHVSSQWRQVISVQVSNLPDSET